MYLDYGYLRRALWRIQESLIKKEVVQAGNRLRDLRTKLNVEEFKKDKEYKFIKEVD